MLPLVWVLFCGGQNQNRAGICLACVRVSKLLLIKHFLFTRSCAKGLMYLI